MNNIEKVLKRISNKLGAELKMINKDYVAVYSTEESIKKIFLAELKNYSFVTAKGEGDTARMIFKHA